MRLLYIWEPQTEEKRLEFIKWMRELNLGMTGYTPERELSYRLQQQRYSGRMAIWINTYIYPFCCGITILAQPGWSFEFNYEDDLQWPSCPPRVQYISGGATPFDSNANCITVGSYSDLDVMRAAMANTLREQIGMQGCYMISDYADGRGQLWPFVNQLLDRKRFSLESVAHFQNGNTRAMLGTWIARNIYSGGLMLERNAPYLDPKLNKSFYDAVLPSPAKAIIDGKEYV